MSLEIPQCIVLAVNMISQVNIKILITLENLTPGPLDYDIEKAVARNKNVLSYTIGSKFKQSSFIKESKGIMRSI